MIARARREFQKQNEEKTQKIRKELQLGQLKKQEFLETKRVQAKRDTDRLRETSRKEIFDFEKEA
jgi:hypothetical protein